MCVPAESHKKRLTMFYGRWKKKLLTLRYITRSRTVCDGIQIKFYINILRITNKYKSSEVFYSENITSRSYTYLLCSRTYSTYYTHTKLSFSLSSNLTIYYMYKCDWFESYTLPACDPRVAQLLNLFPGCNIQTLFLLLSSFMYVVQSYSTYFIMYTVNASMYVCMYVCK